MKNIEGYERAILRSILMRTNPEELCEFLNKVFKEKTFIVKEKNKTKSGNEKIQKATNSS